MIIKHVFFDLDHTLWDFDTNSAKTFKFIFSKNNIDLDLATFQEIYKPINQHYWKLYREEHISKPNLRYRRLKDTFDALGYKVNDATINILSKEYIDYLPNYNVLIDGAVEILDYLKPKYQLHIITNGFEEIQLQKLENSSIKPYFNKIITSESVGVKKPNPKIFNYALQIAEAKPNESCMIGDNLEADIEGAINMNLHAIFCNFENLSIPQNIITIYHLLELKQYL